jgi:hypothetical protein
MSVIALVVVTALIVVPGLGAGLALHPPGTVGLPTRCALVFVLGCCISGLISFVLAILHVLTAASYFPALAVATAVVWWVGLRRGSLRAHTTAAVAEVRSDPWVLGTGLLVIAGIALVRLTFPPVLHFGFSTSWRYWADAVEIAQAHRIPALSLQYGIPVRPTVNKVFLNTLNAGLSFAVGREALPAMGAMLWIGSVGLAFSLWALGRELGLRLMAALLPVFLITNRLFLNHELTVDLNTYKAEIFGRMLAFGTLALAIRALRERRGWIEPVVAGALFALAFDIHLVPVIAGLSMLAWYAAARMVADRTLLPVATRAVVVAAIAGVLAAVILVLPHGDLGFKGPGKSESYTQFGPGFDPTRYLNGGVLPGHESPAPNRWYISPGHALRSYVTSSTNVSGESRIGKLSPVFRFVIPIGGLLAAVVILLLFPSALKASGFAAWGLGLTLIALTWFFSLRYHLYIPAWFGIRRLFDYSAIPLVVLALALFEGLLILIGRIRTWAPVAIAVACTLLAAGFLVPGARVAPSRIAVDQQLVEPFDWIRQHTPCDARILANEHTEGVFVALTGRVGVLEGMTPYLRPDILVPIVRLLLSAREFFHDPLANEAFLQQQGIDYVVLLKRGAVGYREPIGKTDLAAIESAPFLKPVHLTPAMSIYQVVGVSTVGSFSDPSRFPGYTCERGPIAT